MAWNNAKPTVTDAGETTIQAGSTHISLPVQISISNEGPNPVYLGPTGVTSTTGYPVAANEKFQTTIYPGNTLVAKCAAGQTAVLRILKDNQAS